MNETKIFALGGLCEVGKNMYVIWHDDEIIIVDAPEFCSNVIFQCLSKPFIIRFLFCQDFYIFILCNCM